MCLSTVCLKSFRYTQIEGICKHKNEYDSEVEKGLKTLWEKEKMLVTSIFSFSFSVFERLLSKSCFMFGFCGKGLMKPKTNYL